MNIRHATERDLDIIQELEILCFKDPYPKEVLYMLLSLYPELFLVFEQDNIVIGYISGVIRSDGYGHIVSICVHPMYRGRGIGTKLIDIIERIFIKVFNICRYRLEVRVSNVEAISFYTKLGYNIIDRMPSYYPDGEDAHIMIKDSCTDIT